MNLFRKKFESGLVTVSEDIQDDINLGGPEEEEAAIQNTLDPQTDPDALTVPDNPEIALKQQQNERTIQTLNTWISEISNFIEYLNGTEEGSVNFAINSADCDSLMTDIQRSESKKISRLAQDLSSLEESLKQYLLLARKKQTSRESI